MVAPSALRYFYPLLPMPRGRPSGLPLDPEAPGPILHATVEIDNRGRARLPAKITQQVKWIARGSGVDALGILGDPGELALVSWEDHAEPVIARRRELVARSRTDPSALDALRVLEDRYKRIRVPADLRPTFTPEILLHLEISLASTSAVFLTCILDRVELISPSHRQRLHSRVSEDLQDLPE